MHTTLYLNDKVFHNKLKKLASIQGRSVNKLVIDAVGLYMNSKYKQTLDTFTSNEGIKKIEIPSIYDDRKTMVLKWNAISTDDLFNIDHKMVMFEDTFRKIIRGRTDV